MLEGMTGPSLKRCFDLFAAAGGLVTLAPLLLCIATIVKVIDGGPVLFRQIRLGRGGRPFKVLKFRSMSLLTSGGPSITVAGDRRITPLGRVLRRTKLDELPQLWNVVTGAMSLVGPRPESPVYLPDYPEELLPVLELRPGITDLASLYFRREEDLLAAASEPETFYRRICLPTKLRMSLVYARHRNFRDDMKVIFRTLLPGLKWPTVAECLRPEVYRVPTIPPLS